MEVLGSERGCANLFGAKRCQINSPRTRMKIRRFLPMVRESHSRPSNLIRICSLGEDWGRESEKRNRKGEGGEVGWHFGGFGGGGREMRAAGSLSIAVRLSVYI